MMLLKAGDSGGVLDFKGGKYLIRDVQVISEDEEPKFYNIYKKKYAHRNRPSTKDR